MYSQSGFGLPDFCHHVHILHSPGDYLATLLEDFYDSQNEVKKKDGRKGTSRLFIEWCRYVKYKCLHQLNNKKSFLKHIFKCIVSKKKNIFCVQSSTTIAEKSMYFEYFIEQKIPINNKMASDLISVKTLPSKLGLYKITK